MLEPAARSIMYGDIHALATVFAVHVQVRRAWELREPAPTFNPWPLLGVAAARVRPVEATLGVK